MDRGIDPRTARRARRPAPLSEAASPSDKHSIEFLAHEFLERHVKPQRRRPEYAERILARDVLPEWRGRDARTLTPREVIELLDGIVARGSRVMANGVAAFTPHDLRRTGRTGLARLGIKVDIAERILNHARERMEATYDVHDHIDEKREALAKWAKYLAELRDGPGSR